MPLRRFICKECGEEKKTLKKNTPEHCGKPMKVVLEVGELKFMEKTDPDKNKSQMKDLQKILKERARAHSRDHDMDDLIQNNRKELAHRNSWVNKDGVKRKKIDDR